MSLNETLYLKIKNAVAEAIFETLHHYWSDKDRHAYIRNVDIYPTLKDQKIKAEGYFKKFMLVADKIRAARNAKERDMLLLDLIQIMEACNQTSMPKSHNIGVYLDDFGREQKAELHKLNDRCWDLKNEIYQIKYDMAEEVLKLKKEFPDLDIRAWLTEDKRTFQNENKNKKILFPRCLTFYKESKFGDRYAVFHLPVKIDDFIKYDYDVFCGEPIIIRDTENQRIKTPKWEKAYIDNRDKELRDAKRSLYIKDLIKTGTLILNDNNWELPAVYHIKDYYTPVKDAYHYNTWLITNKKHQPLKFYNYEFTDDGGILLSNDEYMFEIYSDGTVNREEY